MFVSVVFDYFLLSPDVSSGSCLQMFVKDIS